MYYIDQKEIVTINRFYKYRLKELPYWTLTYLSTHFIARQIGAYVYQNNMRFFGAVPHKKPMIVPWGPYKDDAESTPTTGEAVRSSESSRLSLDQTCGP